MHQSLLKIISTQIGNLISIGGSLKHAGKGSDDFQPLIREAWARLGRPGQGKTPDKSASAMIRPAGSPGMQSKNGVAGKKDMERSRVDLRDLTPLAVLLHESGISPERTRVFLDSLMAHAPEARMPVKELLSRIRSMIVAEKGGDGRIHLEPRARLGVESALTGMGFSSKEADQALSPSSSGESRVDLERFIRVTLLQRTQGTEKVNARDDSEPFKGGNTDHGARAVTPQSGGPASGPARVQATVAPFVSQDGKHAPGLPAGAGSQGMAIEESVLSFSAQKSTAGPAAGPHESKEKNARRVAEVLLSQAAQKPAAKQGSGKLFFTQDETSRKPDPLSGHGTTAKEGEAETQILRGKGWNGPDGSPRAVKEAPFEEGATPFQSRSVFSSGSGPQQSWVNSAGTPAPPSPFAESLVPAHVAVQVSRQISRAVQSGDQTIRFQLNPPGLGTLRVRLEWGRETLRIEMMTDRYPVKEVLLSSVAELKQALGEQGFRVDKLEVQVNESAGQNLSAFDREHRDPSRGGAGAGEEFFFFPEESKGNESAHQFNHPDRRLLDVVA